MAGWCGAEKISRRRAMILTDGDPCSRRADPAQRRKGVRGGPVPGFLPAASMARTADCGLQRLFDGLLREGGHCEKVDDFSFYEEGGYSATIRGSRYCWARPPSCGRWVRLPGGINLRTGIFLAMDRQLAAVFAVEVPARRTDFALRMMRRSRITPILASRDPNITPALLKRKFHKGVKVEPQSDGPVAFSEAELDRGCPGPCFGRTAAPCGSGSSRRLCKAVRRATALVSCWAAWPGRCCPLYGVPRRP